MNFFYSFDEVCIDKMQSVYIIYDIVRIYAYNMRIAIYSYMLYSLYATVVCMFSYVAPCAHNSKLVDENN